MRRIEWWGFDVQVIEPKPNEDGKLNVATARFKLWEEVNSYMLVKTWNNIVSRNKLEKGDTLEVWCFRAQTGNRLYFALVKSESKLEPKPEPVVDDARAEDDSSDMEIDDKSMGSSSDTLSVNTLTSEITEMVSSDVEAPNEDEKSREKLG